MRKEYSAPMLFVDKYAPDTMITSSGGTGNPKGGNAGNNQNCWVEVDYYLHVVGDNVCTG